jgi:hypothetical protein
MRNRIIALLLSLMAALGVGFTAASPAQAVMGECTSGSFCIWTNTNYTGSRYQYSYATLVDAYHNGIRLGSGITNRGYSFYNRTGDWVAIYDASNCSTASWYRDMYSGQFASAEGSDWGGRVSSIQLTRASPLTC